MVRSSALIPLAFLAVAAAPARKPPAVDPRLQAEFAASDTDGNGVLSRAEVHARVARMQTSKSELNATQATALADRLFALADADHNGAITPTEMQAAFRATARRYDTNRDGVVSPAERKAARTAIAAEAKGR